MSIETGFEMDEAMWWYYYQEQMMIINSETENEIVYEC